MDIYAHELRGYKREITALKDEIRRNVRPDAEAGNLTAFALGVSNRGHYLLVGLCSLVEALLFELAVEEEKTQSFKLEDLRRSGLSRLQIYLTRSERVDFGKIKDWDKFTHIYSLRNAIVHGYGGLEEESRQDEVIGALKVLGIDSCLVGGRRIRIDSQTLLGFHTVVEKVIVELKERTRQSR